MKRVLSMTMLVLALAAFGFACRKAQDSNANKSAAESNSNRKADDASVKTSPAPSTQDDSGKLLSELVDTVHRLNTARNTGDTRTQEDLLANEFVGDSNGRTFYKADWIDAKGLRNFAEHKVENAEILSHTEYTASMGYDGKTIFNDGTAPDVGRYTVTFVKRDGRWQIKSFKD